MNDLIRTLDRLVRTNRALIRQMGEIARIANHDYTSNDAEHDALTDCADMARHAIACAREEIASIAGYGRGTLDEQQDALLDCAATARHVIEYIRQGGAA